MRVLVAGLIGLLFGFGILLSGMSNPAKVLNFFDVTGTWDPSLAFVMAGAIMVTAPGYALLRRRTAPWLAPSFQWPTRRDIDPLLVGGAALFGIGWGLAGFCPGGVLPAVLGGHTGPVVFVLAMIAGMIGTRMVLADGPPRVTSTPSGAPSS